MMDLGLKKIPWYGQIGAFVFVAAGLVFAYFYLYDATARAEIATKQRTLDGLNGEIAKAQATARKLQEFQAEVDELQRRLDNLKQVLPEEKDVSELLRRIQTLATQSNLEILSFKPMAIVGKQLHAEWPIAINLEGTYHDLGYFLDKVSKESRIINVSGVKVKGDAQRRGAKGADPTKMSTIQAECLATTFVLVDEPVQAPAGGPARPGARPAPATPKK